MKEHKFLLANHSYKTMAQLLKLQQKQAWFNKVEKTVCQNFISYYLVIKWYFAPTLSQMRVLMWGSIGSSSWGCDCRCMVQITGPLQRCQLLGSRDLKFRDCLLYYPVPTPAYIYKLTQSPNNNMHVAQQIIPSLTWGTDQNYLLVMLWWRNDEICLKKGTATILFHWRNFEFGE